MSTLERWLQSCGNKIIRILVLCIMTDLATSSRMDFWASSRYNVTERKEMPLIPYQNGVSGFLFMKVGRCIESR